jgi:hypothetical protein
MTHSDKWFDLLLALRLRLHLRSHPLGAGPSSVVSRQSPPTHPAIAAMDSASSVEANAQQSPHWPWLRTAVITPLLLQSTDNGGGVVLLGGGTRTRARG